MTVATLVPAPAAAPAVLTIPERLQRGAFTSLGRVPGRLLRRLAPRASMSSTSSRAPSAISGSPPFGAAAHSVSVEVHSGAGRTDEAMPMSPANAPLT